MDGKKLKEKTLNKLKEEIKDLDTTLGLAVIQVGNDEASNVYVNQKRKMAIELGYKFVYKIFSSNISQANLIKEIDILNKDDSIHGILVQMPVPEHIDPKAVQNSIDPAKDVDGLTYLNSGRLISKEDGLKPCTPKGIIALLEEYNIPIEGKNAVVVGRSMLVGKPIANLLLNKNATVTICHSKSKDVKKYTKSADIVVVAVGKPHFLTADMVKKGAVIIDVGISRVDGKLYGDVDFEEVSKKASYITPVPGGVGPMTVAELACNVYEAYKLKCK
jgi:methylenetetrahydrofolate dehydrogenase (NADP+)/methenyltetrahydrofolate cyclohydrolase